MTRPSFVLVRKCHLLKKVIFIQQRYRKGRPKLYTNNTTKRSCNLKAAKPFAKFYGAHIS